MNLKNEFGVLTVEEARSMVIKSLETLNHLETL